MAVGGQPPLWERLAQPEPLVHAPRSGTGTPLPRTLPSAARGRLAAPLLAAGVFALVLGLAVANGGYFPTAWGWAALPSLAITLVLLLAGRTATPSRLELGFLASLAAL